MKLLAWKLFGFGGRLARGDWWRLGLPAFIGLIAVNLLVTVGAGPGEAAYSGPAFLRLALSAPLIWALYAIGLKRCHDRGKGRFWLLMFVLVPVLGWGWSVIELGFLRGQAGANRFGPSPLGDESLDDVFA
ncbi:DUF805 domain-containing protein [Caulobacter hibisci]|uniref:DUF805 domain-containing protein n=1 Tax=Caulobacter hibisci TaxID=2035993 RepID=A0ABS0SSB4_9CAUL|nr:DUF805 domain-containing protein [Caulobacter hibisci]MBI1682448.1 DUF805 domain-containing protein [Caulobacter hibisci]